MISNPIKVTKWTPHIKPACFRTEWDFIVWLDQARIAPPEGDNWICEDCTNAYREEMLAANRCCYPERPLDKLEKTRGPK